MSNFWRTLSELNLRRNNKIIVRQSSQDMPSIFQSKKKIYISTEFQIAKTKK